MISPRPSTMAHAVLAVACREPGEVIPADVARDLGRPRSEVVRCVQRLREAGYLEPAAWRPYVEPSDYCLRAAGHSAAWLARWDERLPEWASRLQLRCLRALVEIGPSTLADVSRSVGMEPRGDLKRALAGLAEAGVVSPAAALWPTEKGRGMLTEVCAEGA